MRMQAISCETWGASTQHQHFACSRSIPFTPFAGYMSKRRKAGYKVPFALAISFERLCVPVGMILDTTFLTTYSDQQNACSPVIARPRIKAAIVVSQAQIKYIKALTVNVALAFVCLSDKQVRHVPANSIFVRHCVSAKDFLEPVLRLDFALTGPVQNLRSRVDQRSVTVLSLDHGDHLGCSLALILESSNLVSSQDTVRSVSSCVRQLLLYELVLGNGVAFELLPV